MSERQQHTGSRDVSERKFSVDVTSIMGGTNWDMIAGTFLINLLNLVLPLTLMQVYDRIIPNAALNTLTLLVLGVGAVLMLEALHVWEDRRFSAHSCYVEAGLKKIERYARRP